MEVTKLIKDPLLEEQVQNALIRFYEKLQSIGLSYSIEHYIDTVEINLLNESNEVIGTINVSESPYSDDVDINGIEINHSKYRGQGIADYLLCLATIILVGIYPDHTTVHLDAADYLKDEFIKETEVTYKSNKSKYRLLNFYSKFGFEPDFDMYKPFDMYKTFGEWGLIPMKVEFKTLLSNCNLLNVIQN